MSRHIPRGELLDLLSKALLYIEVEAHWRGDSMTANCKSGFSLLEPHVCSTDHPTSRLAPASTVSVAEPQSTRVTTTAQLKTLNSSSFAQKNDTQDAAPAIPNVLPSTLKESTLSIPSNGNLAPEPNAKRKGSPVPVDGPSEKRPRRETDMDIDSESNLKADLHLAPELPKKTLKPKPRAQGPGDDTTPPQAVKLLPGHKAEVFVCAFNPVQIELLATGSKDAVVNLWNLPRPPHGVNNFARPPPTPLVLENFSKSPQGDLTSLHWNSEGTLLAIGSYDSVLRICTNKGTLYFSHPQHQGPIFATRFSKDGRWLLTASLDGTACLWDVREKCLYKQYRCHKDCCLDVDWLNDDTFASGGADMRINIMRIGENDPIKTLDGHQDEINQIRANPSGTRLASCSDDTTARVWKVDNIPSSADVIPGLVASDHVLVLEGHKHSVSTIGWCPQPPAGMNELLATSSFDGTARLWDSVTGECLKVFADHKRPVYALDFSPNGQFLSTGSGDGWLYIYDVKTHEKKWSWYAGPEKPGVFEIDWQNQSGVNRIALALECRQVAVIDVSKIAALGTPEYIKNTHPKLPIAKPALPRMSLPSSSRG